MSKPPKEVAVPKPTRRDRQLERDLAVMVGDSVKQAKRDAGLTQLDQKAFKHRDGATVSVGRPFNDGWLNILTGIGSSQDKRLYNQSQWGMTLTEQLAEDLYAADATARRIVDLLPHEATREGIEWENPEKSGGIEDELRRLNVWECLREAAQFARLYGGAGIFINDGVTAVEDLGTPLAEGAKIQSLVVLTRWELWAYASQLQRDIDKPGFGTPLSYRLFPRMTFGQTAITVHASRIIRFDGKLLPRLLYIRNNFWHDSVLTALVESIGDYKVTHSAVANVLQGFSILVHKIEGLSDALQAGKEKEVKDRFEIMNLAKSVLGSWVIDAKDDSDYHSPSLAGVADCANLIKERLQGETDMPHTILFNEGPGGALAGGQAGNSEERSWYNSVHAWQVNYLKPRFDQLLGLIIAQPGGATGTAQDHTYKFKQLWQQDAKEKADMELAQAQADEINIGNGVRTPAAVQKERFPEEYAETPADDDFTQKVDPTDPTAGGEGEDGVEPAPDSSAGKPQEEGADAQGQQ